MTRYDMMCNDHREGSYIMSLYNQALEVPDLRKKVSSKFLDVISDSRLNLSVIPMGYRGIRVDFVPYVLCMSTNIDDEHMRDYYRTTGRGGWLRLNGFIRQYGNCGGLVNNHFDECMLLGFQKICYDEKYIISNLTALIEDFYRFGRDDPDVARDCISDCLSRMSLSVKAPYDDNGKPTSLEHETRLVYNVPVEDHQDLFDGMSEYRQVDNNHIALPLAKHSKENGFSIEVYSFFTETINRVREADGYECNLLLYDLNKLQRL